MKNKLFCLIGPSGLGKTTVKDFLLRESEKMEYLPSYTTRPPRSNEKNGIDYYFISLKEFESLRDQNKLLEWEEHFGNYYGLSKDLFYKKIEAGKSIVKEIAIDGYRQILAAGIDRDLIYSIFFEPANIDDVISRLKERGDLDIKQRVESLYAELNDKEGCDICVTSKKNELETLCFEVKGIIESKRKNLVR